MRLFISYRRDDSGGHAGRLYDTLQREFPHPGFMDVQAIQGAEDFVATMEREIERSDALIAVIGPDWTGGARRMANPSDHVRRELDAWERRSGRRSRSPGSSACGASTTTGPSL
jgi:TIR domain